MICKWCGENDVQSGEACAFCGTLFGEDKPKITEVKKPAPKKKGK